MEATWSLLFFALFYSGYFLMEGHFGNALRAAWRPLLVFVILGLACLLVPHFLFSAFAAEYLAAYFGYFGIAVVALVSIAACLRGVEWRGLIRGWKVRRWILLGGLSVVTFLSLRLEPQTFKIVMDEPMLASVSASMHRDRLALYPGRGNDLNGAYEYLDGKVDKRPLLFPFLVSVLHDFTGYRLENVFWLNALVAPLFWFLIFVVGRKLGGRRDEAGILGVLIVFAVPLVTHLATSGGFDFLSATLLVLSVYWLQRVFAEPDRDVPLVALTGSLALLANTRYEGPYWILPFGLAILFLWIQRREIRLPRLLVCAPLLVLPALVHRQVYSKIETMWQVGIFDRKETFSMGYVRENLEAAGVFFFSLSKDFANNYLVSVLGLAGALTVVAVVMQKCFVKGSGSLSPNERAGAFFGLGLFGLFWVIMAFNWGFFANYITMRLSLPFLVGTGLIVPWAAFAAPRLFALLGIVVALGVGGLHFQLFDDVSLWEKGIYLLVATFGGVGWTLFLLRKEKWSPRWLFVYVSVSIVLSTFPRLNVHNYLERYAPRQAVVALLDLTREMNRNERILMVSSLPLVPALEFVPSIDPPTLIGNQSVVAYRLNVQQAYDSIYFFSVFLFDAESEQWNPERDYKVDSHFKLELVRKVPIGASRQGRFYRVIPYVEDRTADGAGNEQQAEPESEKALSSELPPDKNSPELSELNADTASTESP
jgi:hypothetical protein